MEKQRELLVMELRTLRKGRGATLLKMQACPVLLEALGNPSDPLEALRKKVEELPDPQPLLAALGLSRGDRTLTERRHGVAVQLVKHPDTIVSWENLMILELVARLETSTESREDWLEKSLMNVMWTLLDYLGNEDAVVANDAKRDQLRAAASEAYEKAMANGDWPSWQEAERALSIEIGHARGRAEVRVEVSNLVTELLEGLKA